MRFWWRGYGVFCFECVQVHQRFSVFRGSGPASGARVSGRLRFSYSLFETLVKTPPNVLRTLLCQIFFADSLFIEFSHSLLCVPEDFRISCIVERFSVVPCFSNLLFCIIIFFHFRIFSASDRIRMPFCPPTFISSLFICFEFTDQQEPKQHFVFTVSLIFDVLRLLCCLVFQLLIPEAPRTFPSLV